MVSTARKFLCTVFIVIVFAALGALVACNSSGKSKFVKIEMKSLPAVTEYAIGETFSPDGGEINAVYSDGSKTAMSLTDDGVTLSDADMTKTGNKRVLVTYNGDSTSFVITVKDKAALPLVTDLQLTAKPTKVSYVLGETFSLAGASLTATYEDNTTATVALDDEHVTVSKPDMNVIGPQTVTITYGGREVEFTINVDFVTAPTATVSAIEINKLPDLVVYEEGETFSAAGGILEVTYSDNTKVLVSMSAQGVTFSGNSIATEGEKQVTVTYGGANAMFTVSVLPSGSTVSSEGVVKVAWATRPDFENTEYFVGDEFDIASHGGEITVTYSDGSEITVPVTTRGITVAAVDTSRAGSKTVRVSVGTRYVTFKVTVLKLGGTVTFDGNYEGSVNQEARFAEGRLISEKVVQPVRAGYTFRGWYKDATCTVPFEFDRVMVSGNTSIYAGWTDNASASYTVTYDMNYYGVRIRTYMHYVKEGDAARRLYDNSLDNPARAKFAFAGWYADANGSAAYDFTAPVTSDTVIYAKWMRTDTASADYRFEAENVSLEGMEGPGASGTNAGVNMIVNDATGVGASGGQYVSYLYKKGLTLNFYLAASEADSNATISFYIAADAALGTDISINSDTYQIKVNGEVQNYGAVTLTLANHSKIGKYIVISGVNLKAGENHIEMITNNDVNPLGDGVGTYAGTAPIVDCIEITSTAVVTWDETKGLPAN